LRFADDSGASHDIVLGDLTLSRGGWRGDAIMFAWEQEGRTWAIGLGGEKKFIERDRCQHQACLMGHLPILLGEAA
jgi:hypothetical protein